MARKSRKNAVSVESVKEPKARIWKAALYTRLSVKDNSNRGDSLESQRRIMEAYIALCPDIEVADIYTDNGVSGQTFERKAFQRMLEDAEAGKVDCILVKDLSRLGRNAIDAGYYIEEYFPLHHIRFISVNDQYDSMEAGSDRKHTILALQNIVNESYALDTSRKVRLQQRQFIEAGKFVGARPPYGYKKDPVDCHKLLVNADTAPIVRQIFQWAADGIPKNQIVKRLNEAGIPTPGHYLASIGLITSERLMGSGKWQTWSVKKILEDKVYVGDMVQGKTKSVEHRQIPTSSEDWITVHDTHEPLVSRELFEQAQETRSKAAAKYTQTEKVSYTANILRGRIFCGHCKKNLHRQRSHNQYFYRCISNDRVGAGACAGDIRLLPEEELFSAILTIIRQEAVAVVGKGEELDLNGRAAAHKAMVERELSGLRRKMAVNKKRLTALFESYANGGLSRADFIAMKSEYEQENEAILVQVEQLLERQKELEGQLHQYRELSDWLAAMCADRTLTGELIDSMVDHIDVHSSKDISVYFKFRSEFDQVV